MAVTRTGLDRIALAGLAALSAAPLGCIVEHDIFARESRDARPPPTVAVAPAATPAPAAPRRPSAAPEALRNPYAMTDEEAKAEEADDAVAGSATPAEGAEPPEGPPMTAAEAAAALGDDADSDEDPQPPAAPGGPAPSAAAAPDDLPPPGAAIEPARFRERLAPYGRWLDTPEYGEVWVPANVSADWRPYWDGRWVWTDWGWAFASADPWGWATWHYGRWGFGVGIGWYWIPGSVWAPAWVRWRWGHGWACWAPWGQRWSWRSPAWVVVRGRHFTRPIRAVALAPHAGLRPIARARPLGAPASRPVVGGAFGPPRHEVEAAVGHAIARRPVAVAIRPRPLVRTAAPRAGVRVQGGAGLPSGAAHAGRPTSVVPPIKTGRVRPPPRPREKWIEPGGSTAAGRVRPQVARPPGSDGLKARTNGGGRAQGGSTGSARPSGGGARASSGAAGSGARSGGTGGGHSSGSRGGHASGSSDGHGKGR